MTGTTETMSSDDMRREAMECAQRARARIGQMVGRVGQPAPPAAAQQVHATAALAEATLAGFWMTAAMDATPPSPLFVDHDR